MTLHLPRRRFLTSALGLLAAPMIVRVSSIMPVRPLKPPVKLFVVTTVGWSDRPEGYFIYRAVGQPLGPLEFVFSRNGDYRPGDIIEVPA
jgi:hypothetical protein